MTKLRMTATALVTTTTVIILGIYDLVCVVIGYLGGEGTSVTVSHFFVNVGFDAPMVVFTIGFICGHFFGYMKPVREEKQMAN